MVNVIFEGSGAACGRRRWFPDPVLTTLILLLGALVRVI
jgi:hypothetical protein